jgi:hypothetical protein
MEYQVEQREYCRTTQESNLFSTFSRSLVVA